MTLEELKAEAARQGFELQRYRPKTEYVPFEPCICGGRKHHTWATSRKPEGSYNWVHEQYYECARCHITSEKYPGKTKNAARSGWNRMIAERRAKNGEKG